MNETDLKNLKDDITEAIRNQQCVKVGRNTIGKSSLYGYPIGILDGWCLVQKVDDFAVDGFFIFRLKDCTYFKAYPHDDMYSQILVMEGQKDNVRYDQIPFHETAIKDVLELFCQKEDIIIVECEKREEFFIGKIKKVNKTTVLFHYFDPGGVWDDALDRIRWSSMTLIKFGGRYETIFSKYLPVEKEVQLIR